MTHEQKDSEDCCPKFDPTPWQEKEFTWSDKKFIVESMPQMFHMPIPGLGLFGKAVTRMWEKAKAAGADVEMTDFLLLAQDPSPWKSELYMNVTKEVPDAKNVTISGNFMTKVYDGPFQDVPKWMKDMEEYVEEKGKTIEKFYVYYTTCPKCAKKFGTNYVVVFAKVG